MPVRRGRAASDAVRSVNEEQAAVTSLDVAVPARTRFHRCRRRRRCACAPRMSAWLLQLVWLVLCRPSRVHGLASNGGSDNSNAQLPQDLVLNELPPQAISGICMTSEPQPDCGVQVWDDVSCSQVLKWYWFDPASTCCSFRDTNGGNGCTLTVGGAGSTCTWREPGSTNRYFTVKIMDVSTSACPPSQYTIPSGAFTSPGVPSTMPPPTQAPSLQLGSDAPSLLPSLLPSLSPPDAVPIPSQAPTSPKSRSPTTRPTPAPTPAPMEHHDGSDDGLPYIPEAPLPSPSSGSLPGPTAAATASAAPTNSKPFSTEPQQMTNRTSGSCWATDPTPECGLLEVPSVTCTDLLQAFEWSGTCCSFRDAPRATMGGSGCSLTVGGPSSHCTWRQKGDGGENSYTMYMSGTSTSTCPPSAYTVPIGSGAAVDGWDGPTPAPKRSTGSCWTTTPNEECGLYTWSNPCGDVAVAYEWEGTCCSLTDTDSGGCRLAVDGPRSQCAFRDATSEYSIFVAEGADGSCPKSSYDVAAHDTGTTYDSPTPEPVTSGYCKTTYPDESCGMYEWNSSCASLLSKYEWSGTCCALAGTAQGGCRLVVDGPGSTCTWKETGKESYFSVDIDEQNDRTCPASSASSAVPDAKPPSEFAQCATQAFSDCLTTCEPYPTLRQSFKACARTDPAQAVQCAAGAASVCLGAEGKAPVVLCQQLASMVASGALHSAQCLSLQEKCALHGDICA